MAKTTAFLSILALSTLFSVAPAYDVTPTQDICVADRASSEIVINGLPCKDFSKAEPDDFIFMGLHSPGDTSNPFGANIKFASIDSVAGLNTLGIALFRLDFRPNGFVPPHVHPRASEIITVLEGSIEVGFVTSYPDYKHFQKVLEKGDFFVVPMGLLHYHRQVGPGNASAIMVANSQNPGIIYLTDEIYQAYPTIDITFLAEAMSVDEAVLLDAQDHYPSTRIII